MTATHSQIVKAIGLLRPTSGFSLNGDEYPDGLTWFDDAAQPPTLADVNGAIAMLPPPPAYVAAFALLGRLTIDEYTGIRRAAAGALATGNGQLEQWLDMARTAANGVDLNDPITVGAKASLVALKLLTQDRADAVFVVG